ncbi:MAG TPA: HigA family addiction module antitoxin [Terriglobales bacterium]|jgi:addiction module HigA family antidote|nr:HigA family addiction module antitoxin [Terriglobales bacterium]
MLPTHRIATHPGKVLLEEFLKPSGISQAELARRLKISANRLNEIVREKRGVSAETALLLAGFLKTTPEFWMNLQVAYDLTRARARRRVA